MLKIISPNIEQKDGKSTLSKYYFSGSKGRKFITIKNTSPSIVGATFSISQSLSGSTGLTGGFSVFPGSSIGATTSFVNLLGNSFFSLGIDYNNLDGDSTIANLNSSISIYSEDGIEIIGPTSSISFESVNNEVFTKRELGSVLCQDDTGKYQLTQIGTKVTEDETSFGLVRTNPKLTGNIKLTVDSTGEIWLNSIDAVKELSDDKYKKYRLGKGSSYASDTYKFFDEGGTPPELVYSLYQADSQYVSTKRNFSEQFDRFYQYGVSELKSKFYDEDFSFFAPLYLKQEIPEYFVIFRTNGPINKFSFDVNEAEWPEYVKTEILKNSQIIKTYDLGENTAIGSYLRNIVNHPSRSESDLTVSYQPGGYTTYNGILYTKGSFAQMGELLYDYYNQENPLISTEEFITLGFERNKVLSSHIINLEFLFDDIDAEKYSINRYFGFYVNSIDLANFTMDDKALQEFSLSIEQLPLPRKNVDGNKVSQKSFTQTNVNGISIFADSDSIERSYDVDYEKVFSSTISSIYKDDTYIYIDLPGNFESRISSDDTFIIKSFTNEASALIYDSTYNNDITTVSFLISNFVSDITLTNFLLSYNYSCSFYNESKKSSYKKGIFDSNFISDTGRFFYIKGNTGNLYSVNNTFTKNYIIDSFNEKETIQIQLKDSKIDISEFGGFSNILTQTSGKTINEKGKSSIFIEISDFFIANDFIEISWENGATNSGYPFRWKVIANESDLSPGESWPAYAIGEDSIGQYYFTYFHPGDSTIHVKDFVKSIQAAFNRFEFKNFEVLSKENFLYFKSTQDGVSSNNAKMTFFNSDPVIDVMNTGTKQFGEVFFIGGTDKKNTRCRIDKDVAKGMLESEYISTKGSFSLIKKYNILGKTIVFAPYLDEPIYDKNGILVDFANSDVYMTVALENESNAIQLTSDSKLTTYDLYTPSLGILSLMPLKDFDTDFYDSDYTRSYTPELIEYFGRPETATIIGVTGNDTYEFDKNYWFETSVPYLTLTPDGSNVPTLSNSDSQFLFTATGSTAQLIFGPSGSSVLNVGDSIVFLPNNKQTYFTDKELSKFKGFLSLSGIISSSEEEEFRLLENLWDPKRFTFQLLNSEYDRLEENYLKSLVLKSRIVPFISKWVSPQGKDVRDNPYRLNYHRAFGNMNFSPSSEMNVPDPRYHTHEWPYLDTVPDKFPIASFPDYTFSYMFEKLSDKYDFSSLDRDWFSEYFTVGYPIEKYVDDSGILTSAKIDPTERYSYFNYQNYDDKTNTLFRGYRFNIKELDLNNSPVDFSTKYDDYKFSVIIETLEENVFVYENPVEFKTIVNEKWKFILIKITVRTSSYRFTGGNMRYADLYTLYNSSELGVFEYGATYSSILTKYTEALPVDKRLSTQVLFGSTGLEFTVSSSDDYYLENLSDEIVTLSGGNFSNIIGAYDPGDVYKTTVSLSQIDNVDYNTLTLSNDDGYKLTGNFPYLTLISVNNSINPIWSNYVYYHQSGGDGSYAGMRNRLSFAEILKAIQGTSDKAKMNYEIYQENGGLLKTANFLITPVSPESLTRIYDYYPVNDTDKPQEFYSIPQISVVLEQQKDLQTLYRYQGNFSVKLKDVIKFWLREEDSFSNITNKDFLLCNTKLGTELVNFSILKNQFYNKVSDTEILSISPDSGYNPVYPLINEISIDKKNIFAWSSTWDKDYYRKYISTSEYSNVNGTEEMAEFKSFMGSKAMKVPKQYDLFNFKLTTAGNKKLNLFPSDEFIYYEDSKYAYIRINAYNRLLREMIGTDTDYRARTEFIKTSNEIPTAFNDISQLNVYAEKYLRNNILDLYQITDIKMYILETGNPGEKTVSTITPKSQHRLPVEFNIINNENITLSESVLTSKGYHKKTDVKVNILGNLEFEIKYPLDSRYYTSFSMGVEVKRI